jgi:hypothetical protein
MPIPVPTPAQQFALTLKMERLWILFLDRESPERRLARKAELDISIERWPKQVWS